MIAGLIAHMPVMIHNYPTLDTFWNIYSDQNMITSGRQFLTIACAPTSFYNLTWINGVVALFYLAISAVILTELFHIEKKLPAAFVGAVLTTFPAVTGTFAFVYTIDGYLLAFLIVCASVLLAKRTKWGFLPAILGIGFANGVYQSYFSVAILLCIFVMLQDVLSGGKKANCVTQDCGSEEKENSADNSEKEAEKDSRREGGFKNQLLTGLKFLIMGVGGYAFYIVSLKIMLALEGTELSGYQGSDKVGTLDLSSLPAGLKAAFEDFRIFTKGGGIFTVSIYMKIAYALFLVLVIGLFLFLFIKRKSYKSIGNIILTIVLLAMIPFGASLVLVLSPGSLFHILMRMPWAIIFVFGIVLIFEFTKSGEKSKCRFSAVIAALGFAATAVLVFHFIINANIVYFNLNERYEKTYGLALRIADRLEQTEGYKVGDPVAILGGYPNAENYPSTDITERITKAYHLTQGDYCVNSTEKFEEFMKHYLNVTIKSAPFEEQLRIGGTEEFLEMPCFPDVESIQLIDGIWVIKLNG